MWKTDTEIYKEALKVRALRYISRHDGIDIAHYLEMHCGPVLTAFMVKYSPSQVANDLELEIHNLR